MIRIARAPLARIIEHAKAAYPQECCGFLVGRTAEGIREVVSTHPALNANRERPHDRYQIDPKEYMALERSLSGTGLVIVGFYHSHPDNPPVPSSYDEEMAWPTSVLSYLIVSVRGSSVTSYGSWTWSQEKKGFEQEQVDELVR
jgi:proteasome lid subunit RPN8/RPN11